MEKARTKDEAARRLINWHFEVEPDLCVVYRFVAPNEGSDDEPIKLLEVNAATVSTGSIELFGFRPTADIPFRTLIAEITPDDLEAFRNRPEALPKGWSLATAQRFERPKVA